jgi:hypothetical protein
MNIKLLPDLTTNVLALTSEYGYTPDEIISIGIAFASILLKERSLGNRVVIVDAEYQKVAEFKQVEPRAITEMAEKYVRSVCPEMGILSANLLVARLERERDQNASRHHGEG